MNLWIRTQKKDRLCLTHNFVIREANKNGYYAVAENRNKNTIEYGIYSTKERALEVLDEIQEKINNIHKDYLMACMKEKGTYEVIAWSDFTYEMPIE